MIDVVGYLSINRTIHFFLFTIGARKGKIRLGTLTCVIITPTDIHSVHI